MKKMSLVNALVLTATLSTGVLIGAQVNPNRHPNLAAAQSLCSQAYNKVSAAQSANEFDMNGHAAKAKELLGQASTELNEAARAANTNHK